MANNNNNIRSGDVQEQQPYHQTPESVQPLEEKLGQLKVAAQGKLESAADSANQSLKKAQTAAENKHEATKQGLSPASQEQYNSALQQLGKAYQTAQNTGNQVAQQLGLAHDQVRSGVHDLRGVARQEAEQRSRDAQGHVQEGKGALQQGIDTVQDALRQGTAVATQRLQQVTTTAPQQPTATKTSQTNQPNAQEPESSSLLQSVTAVISQTAVSVKEALVGKSTTGGDQSTITDPASHEAAGSTKTVSSSIVDAVTAVANAVKETLAPAAEADQQPAKDGSVDTPVQQQKTTT